MNVLQVSRTSSRNCGVGLFARKLESQLRRAGINVITESLCGPAIPADLVILQHHSELFNDGEVVSLAASCTAPLVLFAHSEVTARLYPQLDGLVAMCAGMLDSTGMPTHLFSHPAWVPRELEDRRSLRREFDLPEERLVVASHGFLRFERQFLEVVEALLSEASRNEWFVELITSPWRLDSPGLISRLQSLQQSAPHHFRFEHSFLDIRTLNRRLQACDLLWCWTGAPCGPYASGVISDQYASGTRLFAADKQQHRHVISLPNVVVGARDIEGFTEGLIAELHRGERTRHNPSPVSWDHCIHDLTAFLRGVASQARYRKS